MQRPLPPRTLDTMSDAIAMSSPNGRTSKRAQAAAAQRLADALFGPGGATREQLHGTPEQPKPWERLRRHARELRDLAARGMRPRAFAREAAKAEAEADRLEGEAKGPPPV